MKTDSKRTGESFINVAGEYTCWALFADTPWYNGWVIPNLNWLYCTNQIGQYWSSWRINSHDSFSIFWSQYERLAKCNFWHKGDLERSVQDCLSVRNWFLSYWCKPARHIVGWYKLGIMIVLLKFIYVHSLHWGCTWTNSCFYYSI